MKTINVSQFSTPRGVSFRNGHIAQCTGSILFSVYSQIVQKLTRNVNAVHPADWGYGHRQPCFDARTQAAVARI